MSISHSLIKTVAAELYGRSLKWVPQETIQAIHQAIKKERNPVGLKTLKLMLDSAERARKDNCLVCSDSGIPIYYANIGTQARLQCDPRVAIKEGFELVIETMEPPILPHVTDPLTLQRSYSGEGIPIVNYDLTYDVDYIEMVCHPKGLGSGQMAELKVFSFPSLKTIQEYILLCVKRAGSRHCPPVIIGVGIGGTIDVAAKLAKKAMLRPLNQSHSDPQIAVMENRLLKAVNATGIGPMGTGGDTTAWAVHVDISASHGFIPIAVCYDCWMGRFKKARIHNSGQVEYFE